MRELTKIIVTGASGFIGHAVQEELRRAFYPVLAFLRPSSEPLVSCRLGSHLYRGDILDPMSLAQPFANGAEAVVHLVGIIDEAGDDTFHKLHVQGTKNVIELCREFKIQKLVFVSALGSRANAASGYHRTKFEAEELVRKSGVPYTILRPSVVFGEGSEFMTILEILARVPRWTPVMGNGQGRLQPVYARDLAKVIRLCLENEKSDNETYDVGGPDVYSMDQMLELVEKRIGKNKIHWPLPSWVGEQTAWAFKAPVLGMLLDWIHRNVYPIPPRINRDQLIMMNEKNVCDPASKDKLHQVVDFDFTRLSSWLYSSEYVERPWKGWTGRFVTPGATPAALPPAPAAKPAAPPPPPKPAVAAAAPAPKA